MRSSSRSLRIGTAAAALLGVATFAPAAFAQTGTQSSAPTVATRTNGAYVFGDIGLSWLRDAPTGGVTYDYDTGYAIAFGGGWGFGNGFRVEGEYAHRGNDVGNANGDTSADSLMANVYYDVSTGTRFTPYVGVGTGFARVDFSDVGNRINDSDLVWAYQAIGGLTYQIADQWKLDANYRYFGTETPNVGGVNSHYRDHAVLIGARYEFK